MGLCTSGSRSVFPILTEPAIMIYCRMAALAGFAAPLPFAALAAFATVPGNSGILRFPCAMPGRRANSSPDRCGGGAYSGSGERPPPAGPCGPQPWVPPEAPQRAPGLSPCSKGLSHADSHNGNELRHYTQLNACMHRKAGGCHEPFATE